MDVAEVTRPWRPRDEPFSEACATVDDVAICRSVERRVGAVEPYPGAGYTRGIDALRRPMSPHRLERAGARELRHDAHEARHCRARQARLQLVQSADVEARLRHQHRKACATIVTG